MPAAESRSRFSSTVAARSTSNTVTPKSGRRNANESKPAPRITYCLTPRRTASSRHSSANRARVRCWVVMGMSFLTSTFENSASSTRDPMTRRHRSPTK